MRRVSDENRLKILIEYARGEKVRVIGTRYGVSHTYPSVIAHHVGIRRGATEAECRQAFFAHGQRPLREGKAEPEPSEPTGPDDAMADEIRRLAAKGVARTGIAALLRCANRQVAMVLD